MNIPLLIVGLLTGMAGMFGFMNHQTPQENLGAFSDPYLSRQLAASPQSGYVLSTDGTNNSWIVSTGGGGGGGVGWATTTGNTILYNTLGTSVILSNSSKSATTTKALLNVFGSISADSIISTSTATSSFFAYASTTGVSGTNLNFTSGTTTNFGISTGINLFGGGYLTTNNALCIQLTGSADLCDGSDATGAGGGGLATSTAIADTEVIYGTAVNTVGSEAAFTYDDATNKLTVDNISASIATSTTLAVTTTFNFLGTIITNIATWFSTTLNAVSSFVAAGSSTWDFGGAASTEIVNGSSPTVDAAGEIAIDTTSGQLKWFSGSATHILTGTSSPAFNIGSTTPDGAGAVFKTATTTFLLKNPPEATTLIGWYCVATSTGSVTVRFGDGTNWTNSSACSTTGAVTYASSNNTFTQWEDMKVQIGSAASSPNRVTITTIISKTAD